MGKANRNVNKIDKYLVATIGFAFIYVITMVVIFCIKGEYPENLSQYVITYTLGECGVCGAIKVVSEFEQFLANKKEKQVCNGDCATCDYNKGES